MIQRVGADRELALEAEVCIVGSGAGGSAVALAACRASRDVVLLEAGDHHDPATFDQTESTMMGRLYHDSGQQMTADQAMVVLTGMGLGGSTVHNTALCVPPPAALLDRFAASGALPAPRRHFDAIVDSVMRRLRAQPIRLEDVNRSNRLLEAGATRLGFAVLSPQHNRERCDGCGYCILGCAYNRKRHAVFAFLEDAVRAGLRIVTRARVQTLRRESGAWLVRGPGFAVRARRVVLSAGALRTPDILIRNRLGTRAVGRSLRLHPFAPVAGSSTKWSTRTAAFPNPRSSSATGRSWREAAAATSSWPPRRVPRRRRPSCRGRPDRRAPACANTATSRPRASSCTTSCRPA